jgi:hypothetical protein
MKPIARESGSREILQLRRICMAFPEANERMSHSEPTWFAGKGKVFAMADQYHHGSAHVSVWLPMPMDVQGELLALDSARFFRPPYVGVKGWVGVVLDTSPDWKMVEQLVRDAYVHVASKTLVKRVLAEKKGR